MRRVRWSSGLLLYALLLAPAYLEAQETARTAEVSAAFRAVQTAMGAPGHMELGAFVVPFPRSDLRVTVNGRPVPPGFDLTSITAWHPVGNRYMVSGYLVVLEPEMNPVVDALRDANISVSALVRHMITEQPRLMYVHFQATGNLNALAQGLRNALARTATPVPPSTAAVARPALDAQRLQNIIGRTAMVQGGVVKFTQGRTGVRLNNQTIPPGLGPHSVAFFIGTNQSARVGGEVVLTGNEIQRAIRIFREGGFQVAALHVHIVGESPKLYFLHFAGTGTAEALARVVRRAFDEARSPLNPNAGAAALSAPATQTAQSLPPCPPMSTQTATQSAVLGTRAAPPQPRVIILPAPQSVTPATGCN